MGIVSGITDIFASTQQKRAYQAAINVLNAAKDQAFGESSKLSAQFDPIISDAMSKLGISFDTIQKYLTDAANIDVGAPLNESDRIAMTDAQRLMNENMAKTGNLRSGASSFANEELTRRVIADATTRNFDRTLAKAQLLLGGANELSGVAGMEGNIGMTGKQIAENMFGTGLSIQQQIAQATLGKGMAGASQISSIGDLGDSLLSSAAMAYGGFSGSLPGMGSGMGGAAMGAAMGMNPMLMPMMMMGNYFKGTTTPPPPIVTAAAGNVPGGF